MAIGKRYIDGDKLMETIDGYAPQLARPIKAGIIRWLKRQPKAPKLVSRQGVAEMLGVRTPHVRRYNDRLPEPIHIAGSRWPFYIEDEIKALAREIEQEKAAKKKAAQGKKEPTAQ